jgi:hypothetical protein
MEAGARPSGVRLAELVGARSLATNLGPGQPQEHLLRQTIIARLLAHRPDQVSHTFLGHGQATDLESPSWHKAMGSRLGASARTVDSHLAHISTKIGVSSRGAAAMFAMRHGLVDAIEGA